MAAAPTVESNGRKEPTPLESGEDPGTGGTAKAGKSKKKLVLVALAVIVIAGLAGFFLLGGDAEGGAEPAEPQPGDVVEVTEVTVNLAQSENRFARVGFAVLLAEGVTSDQVSDRFPLLQEAVVRTVSSFSAGDLRAPGGFDSLADALSTRAREIYPDGEVLRVVITDLLVQ